MRTPDGGTAVAADDWTVQVLTRYPPGHAVAWAVTARAMEGVIDAVDSALRPTLGTAALRWSDGDREWTPPLVDLVLSRRERHDDGDLVSGASSVGDLRGELPGDRPVVTLSWELGGQSSTGSMRARFDSGICGPLQDRSPQWLAELLCSVADPLEADRGQITTRALSRALGRAGASLDVGALTLLPTGLPHGFAIPDGFHAIPGQHRYAGGVVIVADLHAVAFSPDVVAAGLLEIDRAMDSGRQGEATRR
ncbi:hypothetical protein ACQPZQ_17440 [Pseudonocardia sp. CA-142604]|uniref:hypothetical protein n=1 Tax=Pseudonocardia sp. CA-142604 TaxID=3240024 RepID=UPI003D8EAEB7